MNNMTLFYEEITVPFPADEEGPFIFAAYSHQDRARVFPILRNLYEQGCLIWYDDGAASEDGYRQNLRAHEEKCALLLLFLTENTSRSVGLMTRVIPQAVEFGKQILCLKMDESAAVPVILPENTMILPFTETADENTENSLSQTLHALTSASSTSMPFTSPRPSSPVLSGISYAAAAMDGGFEFERCLDGIRLLKYQGDAEKIRIPEEYPENSGFKVTETRDTFYGNDRIREVHFPSTVRKLGAGTFSSFLRPDTSLVLHIPSTVSEFDGNWYLPGWSDRHLVIHCAKGSTAWNTASQMKNADVVPDVSLNIPETTPEKPVASPEQLLLKEFKFEIENGGITLLQFLDPRGRETVQLPDPRGGETRGGETVGSFPLLKIGDRAFAGNTRLQKVIIPNGVQVIGKGAFSGCTGLQEIQIPDSVREIGESAFNSCSSLSKLTLPANLKEISPYLFSGCSSLTAIELPEGLQEIGEQPFRGCTSLRKITLPGSLTEISSHSFEGQAGLQEVILRDGIRTIGEFAFAGCTSLRAVTIPNSVDSIKDNAFSDCTSLAEIVFPETLSELGTRALQNCSALCKTALPGGLIEVSYALFSGCTSLTQLTLPDGLQSIRDFAFQGCALRELQIPDTVQYISTWAFFECSGLEKITLPASLKSIDSQTFDKHGKLKEVIIPEGPEEISSYAFHECTALYRLTLPESLHKIGEYAFSGCSGLESLKIPDGVTKIGKNAFFGCTQMKEIVLPGQLEEIPENMLAWCRSLKQIQFPRSLNVIGKNAFKGCTSLNELLIPDTCTAIREGAFEDCESLEKAALPPQMTTFSSDMFKGCRSLKEIEIPAGTTEIPRAMFMNCASLERIELPETIVSVRPGAFDGCTSLREVKIPAAAEKIADGAFSSCTGLEKYEVSPENKALASIDGCLFAGRTLVSVPAGKKGKYSIPGDVTLIADNALAGCKYLEEIVIPEKVTGIGSWAFKGCSSITSIRIPAAVREIQWRAFADCESLGEFEVDERNPVYCSVDGVLMSKDRKVLLYFPPARGGSYTIPSSVLKIEDAFSTRSEELEVIFPNGDVQINGSSFAKDAPIRIVCPARSKVFFKLEAIGMPAVESESTPAVRGGGISGAGRIGNSAGRTDSGEGLLSKIKGLFGLK